MFDKLDIYIALGALVLGIAFVSAVVLAYRGKVPSVETLQELATVFNTKGGIVLVLLVMWTGTLAGTVAFGIWVIAKGIDPQHAVVVTLLGMLVSQAFGNVNGALFTAFKGEDPKPTPGIQSVKTVTEKTTAVAPTETPVTVESSAVTEVPPATVPPVSSVPPPTAGGSSA